MALQPLIELPAPGVLNLIRGDEPIKRAEDDLLGRSKLARVVAGEIGRIDASAGFVVGVLGPWGSGKTSLIQLIVEELGNNTTMPVLAFNPWMFSGTDQLMERFFAELANQLNQQPQTRLKTIAEGFARYGKLISPLKSLPMLGQWVALIEGVPTFAEAVKKFIEEEEGGIAQQRAELRDSLTVLDSPILVVIDDIDRLSPGEIRDIFKLVRLTANFPKIIYLVAFDRLRVEQALSEDGLSGRDYLEKIIQLPFDIPAVPDAALTSQIGQAIDEALADEFAAQRWTAERWVDVFWEVVRPLFRNMRDVRRYAAGLRWTVQSLEGKVALVDVLGLEAVRVFLPDTFAAVIANQDALTAYKPVYPWEQEYDKHRKRTITKLVKSAGPHKAVAAAMIDRLFPVAVRHIRNHEADFGSSGKWVREGRVAHPAVLAYYLERMAGSQLEGGWEAERVVPLLADGPRFEEYVNQKEPTLWVHILGSLWTFVEEIPTEAIGPAVAAICNLIVTATDIGLNPFLSDTRFTGRGLIYRLLKGIGEQSEIEAAVRGAFTRIDTFSGKLELLTTVAHDKEDTVERLISESVWEELASNLREEIRSSGPSRLSTERHLLWVLSWVKPTSRAGEENTSLPLTPELECLLLKAAVSQIATQSLGTRAIDIEATLLWDDLVGIVGTEEGIQQIVDQCRGVGGDAELSSAVELAQRYLDGHRPKTRFHSSR